MQYFEISLHAEGAKTVYWVLTPLFVSTIIYANLSDFVETTLNS